MIEYIYKNSILHGLIGSILCFLYFYLHKDRNKKKQKIDIIPIIIVGCIFWFVSYTYFNDINISTNVVKETIIATNIPASNILEELQDIPGIKDIIITQ